MDFNNIRALLVGAGGIGCELLKTLCLHNFKEIFIIDLDTIDLSNLNRQFLFRLQHIKKSKALVAKEVASKFNPSVHLEARHANIKDPDFNVKFFKGFDIVFNALDNLDARRHVNRMCLTADVPLIESGTTGFQGQVQPIVRGKTECYDCNPKEIPKSFPVCTIRSTPSQPIHCIVWAKSYLFTQLFGIDEEEVPEVDHTADATNAEEIANLKLEAEALKEIKQAMGTKEFATKVFHKVFNTDIQRLLSMSDMWKSRTPPTPLKYSDFTLPSIERMEEIAKDDQKVWNLQENITVFKHSLDRLSRRWKAIQTPNAIQVLTFDKDDIDTLDFVSSTSNIRSTIFSIPSKSKFDIKQMAGNIIPAIATTNAIVSGLCVLQASHVLQNHLDRARMVFISKRPDQAFIAEPLRPPNPLCQVCGIVRGELTCSPTTTLQEIVEMLTDELGYGEEISLLAEGGKLLYDIDFDDLLSRYVKDIGLVEGRTLTVVDEEDDRVNVEFIISEGETFIPPEIGIIPKKPPLAQEETNRVENGVTENGAVGKKRLREEEDDDLDFRKKAKVAVEGTRDIILIDEDDDTVMID